jgi:hypothetical protein
MKTTLAASFLSLILCLIPVASHGQDSAPVLDETDLSDADLPPPSPEQAPESAIVINPEDAQSGDGLVKIVKDSDQYADILRSDKLVERLALVSESGCQVGIGQIGKVSFCSSDTTLELLGRPVFTCPVLSGNTYGPCKVIPKEG